MKLEYLEDFVVLAENMNYEQAAFKLYVSQSTLSKHIQSLEEDLGEPLVYHESGRTFLTEFGKDFVVYARKHVELQQAFRSEHQSLSGSHKTVVRIGYNSHIAPYRCFEALSRFQTDHPGCNIILYDSSIREIFNRGILDLCISLQPAEMAPVFDHKVLAEERFVVVVPASHALADRERISLYEVSRESFFLLQKRCILNSITKTFCLQNGFLPNLAMTLPSCHNILKMVNAGYGITIIPSTIARRMLPENARIIEIEEQYPLNLYLLYPKGKILSNTEETLAEYLKEEAAD